jgi:hypothetical protein
MLLPLGPTVQRMTVLLFFSVSVGRMKLSFQLDRINRIGVVAFFALVWSELVSVFVDIGARIVIPYPEP